MTWINEICSSDTEKRALLIAAANDLAYVVQAVVSSSAFCLRSGTRMTGLQELTRTKAPNFVWKTTDFPAATKGYTWSIVLETLLSKVPPVLSSSML